MSRKTARIALYKLVFEYLFNSEKNELTLAELLTEGGFAAEEADYLGQAYDGICDKFEELSAYVSKYAVGFSLDRMVRSDLAAMLIAIYEMKYVESIPGPVAINEAVELVKKFSTEKSSQFVNGVLSSVYRELKNT